MVTFALLLCYVLAIPLKFQVGWLLVRIQLLLFLSIAVRVVASIHSVSLTRTQIVVFVILGVTVCVSILGHLVAVPGLNLQRIPKVTRFVVLALACVLELGSSERLHKAFLAVTVAATVVAVLSIVNVFVQLPFAYTGKSRALGPITFLPPRSLGIWMSFGSYGIIAVIAAAYSGLCLLRPAAFSQRIGTRRRVLSAVALGLISVAVVIGQSRSTILAFVVVGVCALVVFGFHPNERLRSDVHKIPRAILYTGILSFGLQSSAVLQSFIGANPTSVTRRGDQYLFALSLMSERPLLGWGWNYFRTAFGNIVHNMWLLLGVSLGIPVFLLWVYLFYRLGVTTLRQALSGEGDGQIFGVLGTTILLGATVELGLYPGFTPSAALLVAILTAIVGLRTGGNRGTQS